MAYFRGSQSIRIFRRSRPQSENDRHEIQTLKMATSCESATLPCTSATAFKSAPNLSSQNSALRKSTTSTSVCVSGGKVPQNVDSESRDTKQRDGSFMKKSDEGKKRSDQNPFGQVRPSRSEVISLGCQGSDNPPLSDKQQATNSTASVKPGQSSRQSSCTSLQHPQRAEDVCRGTTAGRSRKEEPVVTPYHFGGAAAEKKMPGGNQHSGDVENRTKESTKRNASEQEKHARKNTPPKEKENGQYQEMSQSEKAQCARRSSVQNHEEISEMNGNVNRNTTEQQIYHHEIQTLKPTVCTSAALPYASAAPPKSTSNLPLQNSALRKSTTSTSLHLSGGKVSQVIDSKSRDEQKEAGSLMKKSNEETKTMFGPSTLSPLASSPALKSAPNLSLDNAALTKYTRRLCLSSGEVLWEVVSESRDEKERDGSFMKKSNEGKKRSDQNPFGQVRPSQSEVIGLGCQGPDNPPLSDKQQATNSTASVKPGQSSRQSSCTSLQHPQRTEDVCRGTTAGRSRKEEPVVTPYHFGGAAAEKKMPGGNQHSGDVENRTKESTKRNASEQEKHARKNTPPKEKENGQYQEMSQSEKAQCARQSSVQNHEERGEMNEDVDRNTPEKETPQRTDKTEARPKHCNTNPSQPVAAECSEENLPKQTTVYIRIHDVITDIAVLGNVLTGRVNTAGVELMPTETGVKHCNKYTYCLLMCDSKNEARKLIGLLLKKRRQFRPQIDCRFTPYTPQKEDQQCNDPSQNAKQQQEQLDDQHQDAKQQEQVKNKRQYAKRQQDQSHAKEMLKKQVLFEINGMSEQALLKHKQAMDDVEKKADKSKSKLGNRDSRKETLAEIAALESKLEELEKEKAEFNKAFEGFKAKLMTLLETDTYEEDVKALRKQLGIECSRLERALPMYARRQDVLHLIQQNRVSILLAETGSGKSTQIVQYLLEAGFAERGMIVCTQPRKVAVITLSTRVAEELASNVGQRVGYKAGVRVKTSPSTKILYMTDHALLNECLTDPDLKSFSCIVVDEAHERSLYTDLLLTMIKRCLNRRPDLKVIITSATIDPQVFVNFFGTCPIMKVSGRAFPVDVVWEDAANEDNEFENYVDSAVSKVVEIHRKEPPGDILVFLTSAAEIQKCCDMTQQRLKDRNDFSCLPLHGQLQSEEQQKVFKPLERNMRKIVYATNCAETSITIDGIKYVVDTGVAKEMVYDAKKKVNSLVVTTISQSSAEQRKGRAGRTAPGRCYRLYSRRSYQSMDKISLPDILKIHLSLALLKLAELGFTPDMYDFVQSPSQDSIDAALKTLHQLEALDNNVITDTGKWIVKLPFDPKLGRMTLNGHRCGLLYDTIVLASLMSTGSGLFYRGSTDKDRNKLDKVKLKFSHQGGDGLTSLEVYKAWQSVDERQKNKWCMGNSVNAKAIRGIRDSVNEIIQVLRKEARIEVSQKFSDAQDAAETLRKIIFQCNVPNLCHYLGKERAGYFAAEASRQVHFHPSSAMCSLASYPQWVVYDQLLKTSRDFITGVTWVDDAWLQEMNTQLYGFDVNQVSQKKLNVVVTQPAGSHAFFAMVGPQYSHLRHYEEEFSAKNAEDVVIVEARKEAGELKVFSTGSAKTVEELKTRLTSIVDEAVREVQQEVQELTIGSEDSGLRVLLGQGGQLTDILMPEETRKVFITHAFDDLTVEMVREKFEDFGDICYIHQFPSGKNWGFVVYRTPAEAAQAAEVTRDDDNCVGELERRRVAKHQAEFKAKLFWCRRPCKGIAYVDISPAFMSLYLQLRDVYVCNSLVNIKINRNRPDEGLCLTGLPADISVDLIKRSLLNALGYRETKEGIIDKVFIVREHVGVTDKNKLKQLEAGLKEKFTTKLKMSSVQVRVWPPKEVHNVRFAAEACFTDPIEGFDACKRLQGRLCIGTAMVDIDPIVSATLHIQRLVYEACKEDLDKLKREKLDDVEMEIEKQGSENWRLHLKADEMQTLVQARTFISEVVKGDVLDCNAAPALRHLMTPAGRKMIKEAEGQTEAYVCVDGRTQTLAIHGSAKACTKMRVKINDYLDEVLSGTVEELTLRGSGRPPGLLKTLITKFDEDLETLRHEAGLFGITVNYRLHKLKLTGSPESIAKAKKTVEELSVTLMESHQQRVDEDEDSIDCVACFCPIDNNDLYRLEACAHPYCKVCFKHQVSVAIKDRHLPVICCYEGCDSPLSWRDFKSLSRQGQLKLPDVASSALSAYVLTNRNKACFCATPNCPMVYRLTSEEDAKTFQCPECSVRVCTGCQAQAHEGVSCSMLRSSDKAKSGVDEWARGDTKNRKACPGCYCPIEKIGGCNKMICNACRTIFCWLCGKKYPTQDACYEHLRRRHGGVFDVNDLLYD